MSNINKYKQVLLLILVAMIIREDAFISRVEAGEIPPPPGITTLWVPVGISTDDAEENVSDGDMYLASSDLELIQDGLSHQKVGLRFTLEIPPGATIESASIQFTTDEKTSEATVLTVYGEAIAHALTFTDTDFDISNRTLTTASVSWMPAPWDTTAEAGSDQQTPDLSAILQEIVNITGWTQGNSIAIIIAGNGKRVAESFNGSAPPVLHVSFFTEITANQTPDAVDDGTFAIPAYTTRVNQPLMVANGADDIVERNDNLGTPAAGISIFDATSTGAGSVIVSLDGSFSYTPAIGFAGIDSFTYTLENTEGSDSATVYISVEDIAELTTLWIPVITSSDDAEEDISDGIVRLTSSDLELIRDGSTAQRVGVRFQALNIPRESVIVEAYIQYTADEDDTEETNLTIYGEANGNPLSFSNTLFDISDRSLTTASVVWMPAPWNTNEQTSSIQATPDLSVIVQEIVNRDDWAQGNAMAFITSGSGKRVAESFNGTAAPVLHVSFAPGFFIPGPEAVDDNFTTVMDVPLAGDLLSNDDLGFPLATVATFDFFSVQGGSVSVSFDGSFTYTPPPAFLGSDSFTYTLSNGVPPESTATVSIEVKAAVELTTLWIPVIIGSDDAEENVVDGDMYLGSSDLEMIMDRSSTQLVGVRFQAVDVPPEAQIEEAYIQYQVDEESAEQTELIIHGEASINALTFNDTDHDISNRTRTDAAMEWMPPAWNTIGSASLEQRTPDLSEIVQEIIELGGWSPGKAMTFITSGSGNRIAESFNGTAPPELHLVYSIPQAGNQAPTATDVAITDTDGAPLVIGHVLSGSYTYGDAESDLEGSSNYRWLRDGAPIAGATTESYTTVAVDAGKTLTFEVTPVATSGTSPGVTTSSPGITVNFQIGDTGPAGGGVFYISDNDGAYGTQGLEVAPEDQGRGPWGCHGLLIAGADGTAVGTGAQNTVDILAGCTEAGTAAELVDQYILNGFDDWFLPSKDTLNLLYEQRTIIGGFDNTLYWSSSENSPFRAWWHSFFDGSQAIAHGKSVEVRVRAVRTFPVVSPPNSRPMATNLSIIDVNGGLLVVGDSVTGNYIYSDADGDTEGASTFRWLRNGVTIPDATSTNYIIVAADERKAITFEVIPVATSGSSPGTTITSPSVIVFLQISENEFQLGGLGPAGGTVIYISDGDGIVGTQGLEVAPEDQGSGPWGCPFLSIAGASGRAIGTGAQNTADILVGCTEAGIAAELADQYILNGFDDWYLPSKDELHLLWQKLAFLAGFEDLTFLASLGLDNGFYWSSTEVDFEFAWSEIIHRSGDQFADEIKSSLMDVRAIRTFPKVSSPNSRPSVTDVSITDTNDGLLIVGDALTASYTYSDPEGDAEGVSILRWLRNGVAIPGATGTSYTTVAVDERAAITFEVTPVAITGTSPGNTITSSSVVALLEIGSTEFQIGGRGPAGGIVFYISDGDGIVGTQGLEVVPENLGSVPWGCLGLLIVGADGTAVGTGAQNTANILANCTETGIAASIADTYSLNGFEDWFLPSKDELHWLEERKFAVGGFPGYNSIYWSSSEFDGRRAWTQRITNEDGRQFSTSKVSEYIVRAIRIFSGGSLANNVPVATNVSIADVNGGLLIVGDSLSGNYAYSDVDGDSEGASNFRWLRNGVAIPSATSTSYTTVSADERKAITFEVTPVATSGSSPGTTITSPSVIVFLQVGANEFQIGGPGPAGGTVIYISDGDGVVGTQGLEVAPEDQGKAPWGCYGSPITGAQGGSIGTGAQNTAAILAGCSETGIAAELADQYTLNGFDDWFLPSLGELILVYEKLAFLSGIEDYSFLVSLGFEDNPYRTSSEFSDDWADIVLLLREGEFLGDESKSDVHNVRAIRAFPTANPPTEYQLGDTGPGGGIVFYISDGDGTVGTHGLEAAPEDQGIAPWGCYESSIAGADGSAVGTGAQNTADILADCAEAGIAADLADMYSINGVDDWYLPSKDTLLLLYEQRAIVGNFNSTYYWSSRENSDYSAWYQSFGSGSQRTGRKDVLYGGRAIRGF